MSLAESRLSSLQNKLGDAGVKQTVEPIAEEPKKKGRVINKKKKTT